MQAKAARNSAVEWIRILAIALIVITHAVPDTLDVAGFTTDSPTSDVNFFFTGILAGFGLIGDVLFLVCSCWFLADSRRASVKKIVSMILTVFIVSIIWLIIIVCLGYELSAGTIVRQIFPTIFQNNWFISYYLVFYAIHPLLNAVVRRLDKRGLGILAGILFFHCFILMWVTNTQLGVNKLLIFITMYFAVAWIKKYATKLTSSRKINLILCFCSIAAYLIFKTALNFIGLHVSFLEGRMMGYVHIYNPIIFIFAISLINLANMRYYVSKPVNHIASLSMLIYIIHRNNLFATLIQPKYYDWAIANFGINTLIAWIFVLAAIMFAGSVILGTLYRYTIERGVNFIGGKAQILFDRIVYKVRAKRAPAAAADRGSPSAGDMNIAAGLPQSEVAATADTAAGEPSENGAADQTAEKREKKD